MHESRQISGRDSVDFLPTLTVDQNEDRRKMSTSITTGTKPSNSGLSPGPTPPAQSCNKARRQSQSCDACRARKVRCAKETQDQKQPCKHCVTLGIPCTYDYQPKKRGPPNLYLRRLQQAQAAGSTSGASAQRRDDSSSDPPIPPLSQPPTGPPHSNVVPSQSGQSQLVFMEPCTAPTLLSSIASQYSTCTDTSSDHYHPAVPLSSQGSYGGSFPSDHSDGHLKARNVTHHQQHLSSPATFLPPNIFPPLSYYCRPHRLEDIAPRNTIFLIVELFFDFVYPLTPCVHKPSFMADLHAHREERDPLFFALVMSTVASTLVQVSRCYLPMERSTVKKLARTCFEASRHITIASYDPPSTTHVVIRYFDCCYQFCSGSDATQHATYGEAAHIAVTLRMHEEASYEGLNPIESEVRRRAFWLLFGADKSMAILLGRPVCFRDEDCTVNFPREIDDEYITSNAYLPQPRGKTSIISGLNYISRIFAILGDVLVRARVDRHSPPRGHFATMRLEQVQSLHTKILETLSQVPEPLRLKTRMPTGYVPIGGMVGGRNSIGIPSVGEYQHGNGFRQVTLGEVKDFFDNPKASRANALNAFLVQQANLYVTQQLVRFVIEQYRDELITMMHGRINERQVMEGKEAVVSDLLEILRSIPIQSIATNGPSLVHKVRFVASTLLDAVEKADSASVPAERAHAYLLDFLSILSEIEKNYMLEDDPSGESAR
ncbi:fungal-specific transcription factor domain-containing protein [Pisolithus marmoratus]|nr:fungal-specific transcription factor domain-containing protein [Pisolithus marmoratus]